jgi:epoxyqueuosine reductase
VAPGVLDATRCISYWTIEHRGPLPIERRGGIGDWIFGCDDCQTCCPWNESFARPPRENPLGRRDDLEGLDPEAILRADEGAFRARYSGTALMRAKWEGMRRNACVVLGNRGDQRAVEALVAALGDPADPVVRGHAAWALGRIGGARAAQALAAHAASETDAAVQREIAAARAAAGDAA